MAKGASKHVGEGQETQKAPQPWTGPSALERQLWARVEARKAVCDCCDELADRVIKVDGHPIAVTWVCGDYTSPTASPPISK